MTMEMPTGGNNYVFDAEVKRWVDGDTVDLLVALPFHLELGNHRKPARFRLLGVNAIELRADGGLAARTFVEGLLPVGTETVIRSYLWDKPDNFGRWLCDIWTPAGVYVNDAIIAMGYGVPYPRKEVK